MKLKYEVGVATLIQFVSLTLLNVANGAVSVVNSCRENSSDCLGDLMISLIFFLLVASWFMFVCMLGFLAQERRSKKIALMLIGAEVLIALVAIFNAKHNAGLLSLFTSLLDLALAIWVIFLASHIIRADGGRVARSTISNRPRQRRRPTAQK